MHELDTLVVHDSSGALVATVAIGEASADYKVVPDAFFRASDVAALGMPTDSEGRPWLEQPGLGRNAVSHWWLVSPSGILLANAFFQCTVGCARSASDERYANRATTSESLEASSFRILCC
jgi:hypothetical protein